MCAQTRACAPRWLASFALLLSMLSGAASQFQLTEYTGELLVVHVHLDVGAAPPPPPPASDGSTDGAFSDETEYQLLTGGPPYRLIWPSPSTPPDALKSGLIVKVTGYLNTTVNTITVYDLEVIQGSDNKEYVAPGEQLRITSITYVLNICGVNTVNINTLRMQWTNDFGGGAGTPGGNTMQNFHALCSYNKTVFLPGDNVVVGPINLPCNGSTNFNTRWQYGFCGNNEIWGWVQAAQAWARQNTNLNLSAYKRTILVLPMMPGCNWAGLGTVGCGSTCFTWLQGPYALALDTVMHELGHNLGLQHSSTPGNEYGDCSCPMGSCAGMRCFNAAQQWRLGWSIPLATLDRTTVPTAAWRAYPLPALQANSGAGAPGGRGADASDQNHLRIVPNWQAAGTTQNIYYVSFRQRVNGDVELTGSSNNRVHVHRYNGDQAYSDELPVLLMTLNQGIEWVDVTGPSKLKIRFDSIVNNLAIVRVCRFTNSPSECDANGNILNTPVCGDGFCGDGETTSCPQDCAPPAAFPPPSPAGGRASPPPPPPVSARSPPPTGVRSPPPPMVRSPPPPPPPPPSPSPPPPRAMPPPPRSPPPPPLRSPPPPPPPDACLRGRAVCGDSFCDMWAGENCRNCPKDCKGRSASLTNRPYCCGDTNSTGCADSRCTQRVPFFLLCRASCANIPASGLWIAQGYDYGYFPPPETSPNPPSPPLPGTAVQQTGNSAALSRSAPISAYLYAALALLALFMCSAHSTWHIDYDE